MEIRKDDDDLTCVKEIRYFAPGNEKLKKFINERTGKRFDWAEVNKIAKIVTRKFYQIDN